MRKEKGEKEIWIFEFKKNFQIFIDLIILPPEYRSVFAV